MTAEEGSTDPVASAIVSSAGTSVGVIGRATSAGLTGGALLGGVYGALVLYAVFFGVALDSLGTEAFSRGTLGELASLTGLLGVALGVGLVFGIFFGAVTGFGVGVVLQQYLRSADTDVTRIRWLAAASSVVFVGVCATVTGILLLGDWRLWESAEPAGVVVFFLVPAVVGAGFMALRAPAICAAPRPRGTAPRSGTDASGRTP